MPVGELNANGWGIQSPEITNVVNSLKQSVVRLCPERDHSCDLTESKPHEIGAVIDAWYDGFNIKAKTEIYNEKARSLVKNGEIKAWSVYGQGDQLPNGFVQNYFNKSLTLVADPAWKSATFSHAASKRFMLTNPVEDITMPDDEAKFLASFDKKIEEERKKTKEEVDALIASKDKQITDLTDLVKTQGDAIEELKKLFKASEDQEDAEDPKEPEVKFASLDQIEDLKKTIKTEDDIDKLVASRLAAASEVAAVASATADYKTLAASLGIKVEDAHFAGKSSAILQSELAVLKQVAASRPPRQPRYHNVPEEFDDSGKLTIGIPDGNGAWKVI